MSPEESDQDLVDAMRRGDVAAFERFYYRHRDWVVSLAHRFSGNREDALDVLQETFAYVLRKLPALELRSQARTFLYPAVKHLALSRKKAARREAALEDEATIPARDDPAEHGAAGRDEVHRLLARLPEEQREVVHLRFVDGLELKEIAAVMGTPLGTVKSRLHSALEALRRGRRPGGESAR